MYFHFSFEMEFHFLCEPLNHYSPRIQSLGNYMWSSDLLVNIILFNLLKPFLQLLRNDVGICVIENFWHPNHTNYKNIIQSFLLYRPQDLGVK